MKYKTTCAVSIKGTRVERGTVVDLEPEVALKYGTDLIAAGASTVVPTEPTPEKPVEKMTATELKEKAAALGLSTSGTKADLIERITLNG